MTREAYRPSVNRLPRHLLLSRDDAWALREIIRPFPFPTKWEEEATNRFIDTLYNALLHIELEGRGEWNLPATVEMVHLLNLHVKSGQWDGADDILIQSWLVLDELGTPTVFEVPAMEDVVLLTQEEVDIAIHPGEGPEEGTGPVEAGDAGGVKLPAKRTGKRVPEPEG